MSVNPNDADAPSTPRRKFLQQSAALGGLALAGSLSLPAEAAAQTVAPAPALAATASVQDDFLASSEFLTGHRLDAALSARFLAALNTSNAGFGASMAQLTRAIKAAGTPNMDAFLALPGNDPAVIATAREVVSAWYLGVVGTGANAVLISFYDALMFAPTRDYTYVPSYGGGPDSWVATPPFKSAQES